MILGLSLWKYAKGKSLLDEGWCFTEDHLGDALGHMFWLERWLLTHTIGVLLLVIPPFLKCQRLNQLFLGVWISVVISLLFPFICLFVCYIWSPLLLLS